MYTQFLLRKRCLAYLAHVTDIRISEVKLEDIPMVHNFPNVYPDELFGLSPNREVEFNIDLVPIRTIVSIGL